MADKAPGLTSLTVISFESRLRLAMERLIEKHGGKAFVAPSMKEVAIAENPGAFDFFEKLERGEFDLVILLTGVATRTLIQTLETRFPKERIIRALSTKTKIVVRGPKPTAVCKMNSIPIAVTAPEPNTWREILAILDEEQLLANRNIAVLEYGISNADFLEELKSRGASVTPVPVYQWALPDDLDPLNQAIDLIVEGKVDLALFTTSVQVDHLLKLSVEKKKELALRRAFHKIGICSIGPTTSEKLRDHQLFPDLEATPNKMESLVEQAAEKGREIADRKKKRAGKAWCQINVGATPRGCPVDGQAQGPAPTISDSLLLRACRRQPNTTIPIWLMRQAGRYMAEYHVSRQGLVFLDFCKRPDLTAEATIYAVERLGVDAGIIFADILLIVEPMGLKLAYLEGEGPVIATPIRDQKAIDQLKPVTVQECLSYVLTAIKTVRQSMKSHIPLIGFCGAPFTVASYMIEGKGNARGSKNFIPTKILMHEHPGAWQKLMEKITIASVDYLNAQIEAGADVVQIFDSWVGCLTPAEYELFVLPYSKLLIEGIKKDVPVIHFGTQTASLLPLMKKAGGDVIGIDAKTDIQKAWDELGEVAVQGNLDPVILFSKPEIIRREAEKILETVGHKPGFIFNLGHGILPETPVDHVLALVDCVHSWII